MTFIRKSLNNCESSPGVVVVIDVIRAFTTAAFVLDAGAKKIILVKSVAEAFKMKNNISNSLIIGEVNGLPPRGFDFGNSPFEFLNVNLNGKTIIQRTSAGTQGVVRCKNADTILAGSFVCAQATINHIRKLQCKSITFVITGLGPGGRGEEDIAFADYIEANLLDQNPDPGPYLKRVKNCRNSQYIFADPDKILFKWEDIECCLDINRFDFPLVVERENDLNIIRPNYSNNSIG